MRRIPMFVPLLAVALSACHPASKGVTTIALPSHADTFASLLGGMSESDLWSCNNGGLTFLYHWDGKSWAQLPSSTVWGNVGFAGDAVWLGTGGGVWGVVTNTAAQGTAGATGLLVYEDSTGAQQDFSGDFSVFPTVSSVIARDFGSTVLAIVQGHNTNDYPQIGPQVFRKTGAHFTAAKALPIGFMFLWAGDAADVWGFSDNTMSTLVHDVNGTLTMSSVPTATGLDSGSYALAGLTKTSSSDVWMWINKVNGGFVSNLFAHWDGTQVTWSSPPANADANANFLDVRVGFSSQSAGVLGLIGLAGQGYEKLDNTAIIYAQTWDGSQLGPQKTLYSCPPLSNGYATSACSINFTVSINDGSVAVLLNGDPTTTTTGGHFFVTDPSAWSR